MLLILLLACKDKDSGDSGDTAATSTACNGPGSICTIAGTGIPGLGQEGAQATETFFYLPQDLTFGPDGLAYILDWNNHRIRRINADGTIQTVAGTGELGDGPEGPATTARFNHPTNIVFRPDGILTLAAWHNSRVENIDLANNTLDFLCGDGKRAFAGDGGPCDVAELDLPSSVAYDSTGNLYISDMANQRIRRMTPDGLIASWGFTGVAGYSGDGGPVDQAQMYATMGQAADPANRIIIEDEVLHLADTENHRIRSVDLASGIVNTIAGSGTPGYTGDNVAATQAGLWGPRDVAMGIDGRIYIADTEDSCIRRIESDGTISTVAGQCTIPGYEGDGGSATDAKLFRPFGITVDADGNLYIADTLNQVLRKVVTPP